MNEKMLTLNDTGKSQSAKFGELIIIKLPENPTTGYNWEIREFDKKIIELADAKYESAEGSQIGGGGMKTFKFKPKSIGSTTVKLILKRISEPDNSAIQHFEANVKVT
jgi:inhibitor of cysteine peptidase